jgi:hypothetical protein
VEASINIIYVSFVVGLWCTLRSLSLSISTNGKDWKNQKKINYTLCLINNEKSCSLLWVFCERNNIQYIRSTLDVCRDPKSLQSVQYIE